MVRDIYAQLPAIVADGLSLIVVEQDIAQALKAAARVYCLQEGRIALQGPAKRNRPARAFPRRISECEDGETFNIVIPGDAANRNPYHVHS